MDHAPPFASPISSIASHPMHVVSANDFAPEDILRLFALAQSFEARPRPDLLGGRIMASLFFEPSTRTRLSFEAAMCKLGGTVIGFADANSTSARKGESLSDTIRMVDQYADVVVLRHPHDGAARLASEISRVPIINGGDGSNQHPSQTFLDLYTIEKLFAGSLTTSKRPLTVCLAGDLRYGRTVHSLVCALMQFPVQLVSYALPGLEIPEYLSAQAKAAGREIQTISSFSDAIASCDVLYMTRLQAERFPDPLEFDHIKAQYCVTLPLLAKARPHLRILHPLPRVGELPPAIDATEHAQYFTQAGNGIPIRQALLATVLGVQP